MFGGWTHRIRRWEQAGLITPDQSAAITAFEQTRRQGRLGRDLTRVALAAILIGIISIVASNWNVIPGEVKLAAHFLLNAVLAFWISRADETQMHRREFAVVALFGLFLSFIALIGQVFQLHGDLYTTLLFWWAICTPFIWFYGRTAIAITPWLGAGLVALGWNIETYLLDQWLPVIAIIALYLPPILALAASSRWVAAQRPGFVGTFRKLALLLPALSATVATISFSGFGRSGLAQYGIQAGLMAAGVLATVWVFRPRAGHDVHTRGVWLYMVLSALLLTMPFLLPTFESDLLSAVLFIGYWLLMAVICTRLGEDRWSEWAIRLVILRLFIVYLEVFGSLLATGFGLVLSGLLLLLVLRYQNRIVAIAKKMIDHDAAP